ncbi:MAG: hypothetical protein BM556_08570 [Bacteriovorax sp. MedPE-SWde]|nr:MAG: hypothetical protein BM556_08570 [Bacteriovorax sp. MedPE-SWde]
MKYILLILACTYSFASVPTVEGLFRNSINPELDDSLVVLTLKGKVLKVQDEESSEDKEPIYTEAYYKFIFDNSNKKIKRVIKSKYESSSMGFSEIKDLQISKDIQLEANEANSNKRIINAIIGMYAMNSSVLMSDVFKTYSSEYMTNEEVLNSEKKELLNKYKEYLVIKNEYDKKLKNLKKSGAVEDGSDIEIADEPKSPLTAEEETEKERISKLISDSMYKKSSQVRLAKEGKDYFWIMDMSNIWAKFTNEDHRLKHLKLTALDKVIEVIPHEAVTFAGKYKMPKNIEVLIDDKQITLEILNYYTLKSKKKSYEQRAAEYKKYFEESSARKKKKVEATVEPEVQEQVSPQISDYLF